MCSVLASPQAMPRFWIFMYRLSPFTYYVSSVLSTGLANTEVQCSSIEFLKLSPPAGQTCGNYLQSYIKAAGGKLTNPTATENCQYCPVADTNTFLRSVNISFDDCWRNIGILFLFIAVNIFGAIGLYWLIRVPKQVFKSKKKG